MPSIKGSCHCGSVKYEITGDPKILANCYCNDCRKLSGTGHSTHIILPDEDVAVSGDLKFYDSTSDSGSTISRGFCPSCGSAVVSRNSARPGMSNIRASSLDDPDQITPVVNVYVGSAVSWDKPNESLPGFEKMPPPPPEPNS